MPGINSFGLGEIAQIILAIAAIISAVVAVVTTRNQKVHEDADAASDLTGAAKNMVDIYRSRMNEDKQSAEERILEMENSYRAKIELFTTENATLQAKILQMDAQIQNLYALIGKMQARIQVLEDENAELKSSNSGTGNLPKTGALVP